jgi:hypothetical protein
MIDNTRLIERLNELAAECTTTAAQFDQVYISSPAHEILKMADTLTFLAKCLTDNTIGLAGWPEIAYSFVVATEKNLPKLKQHQTEIELTP